MMMWALCPLFVLVSEMDGHVTRFAQLNQILTTAVGALGYSYVGCEYLANGPGSILRVYIENEVAGITVDDCAKASRHINAVLAVEEVLKGQFSLEVSSPGIERPLFTLEHFQRFVNHKVAIKLRAKMEGRRNFTGILQRVEDSTVVVSNSDGSESCLSLADIERAHLVSDFGK